MTTEETISHKIMIYAEMRKPDRMNQFAVEEIIREELATLRAKAEAYDKGGEMVEISFPGSTVHMLVEPNNQAVIDIYEKSKGHTCRKVRVCEEVER